METPDLEKLLEGVHVHRDQMNPAGYRFTTCNDCPYKDPEHECFRLLMNDVVGFVEAQQPRVMTLDEAYEADVCWCELEGSDRVPPCRLAPIAGGGVIRRFTGSPETFVAEE